VNNLGRFQQKEKKTQEKEGAKTLNNNTSQREIPKALKAKELRRNYD